MASAQPPSNRSLYQKFLRPSWLAGVISIGFHGALFAAGPTFPSLGFSDLVEPELEAERRNVPLVELSEAEQARLPDFSRSSFYNFDNFDDLEPLSPLFNEQPPPKPGSSDSFTSGVPSPLTRSRPIPTPSSRIPFGITRLEPRPRTTLPSFPQASSAPTNPSRNNPRTNGSNAGATAGSNQNDPDAIARREGTAADLEPVPQNSDQPGTPGGADIAARGNPTEVMTLEERLQAYTYDVTDTEIEAAQARFDDWLTAGQTFAEELEIEEDFAIARGLQLGADGAVENPASAENTDAEVETAEEAADNSIVRAPIELPIDYAQGLCLTKEPQKGLIGAWVSPEGELLGEPEVIRSTGYLGLNQQAVRYIENLDFSSVSSFTGYQFEVVVNYDPEGCVNLGRSTESRDRATPPTEDTAEKEPRKDSGEEVELPFNSADPSSSEGGSANQETVPVKPSSPGAPTPTEAPASAEERP